MSHALSEDDLHDLRMSPEARPLLDRVIRDINHHCLPAEAAYERLGQNRAERFSFAPGQLEIQEDLNDKARAAGLWNFFLPDSETGEGLSNLDYACIAFDQAMQVHGATGGSQWSDLPDMYIHQRTSRFADGPDEVHHHVIARAERQAFAASNERRAVAKAASR